MRLRVYGEPAPQGSKQGFVRGGRVNLVEVSKKVKPWRAAVCASAVTELPHTPEAPFLDQPLSIHICFYLPRPKSVTRLWPYKKPDIDKLIRSTLDGLTEAGVWGDDAQVVSVHAFKMYSDEPGAVIDFGPIPGGSISAVKKETARV